jgi:hypothetical protein
MPAQRYRKRPVSIDAVQWTGDNTDEVLGWMHQHGHNNVLYHAASSDVGTDEQLAIKTLEGVMAAGVGDYIIRGVDGEFYPCKASIFKRTYDPGDVTDVPATALTLGQYRRNLVDQGFDKDLIAALVIDAAQRMHADGITTYGEETEQQP